MIAKLSVVLLLACVAHSKPITVSTAPALSVAHTSLAVEHPTLAVAHAPLALHAPTYAVAHAPTYAVAHSPTYAVAHAPTYAVQQQIAVAHAPALTLTHAPIAVAHAPVAVAHAPVAVAHAPVAQTVDYHAEPKYSFSYGVQDAHTGDAKEQKETRVGDVVHGSYSLIEPDGSKRIVEYTADDHNGFNAVVHREPNAHPAVVSHAPIAVQHASIAVAHAPLALLHH